MTIELTSSIAVAVAASTIAGGIFGRWAAGLSARRSATQPVDVDVAAERSLLEALWTNPEHWVRVAGALSVDDFTSSARAALFVAFTEAAERCAVPAPNPDTTSETDANRIAADVATRVEVCDWQNTVGSFAVADAAGELDRLASSTRARASLKDLMGAGGRVVSATEGRRLNTSASPIVATGDDEAPLRRVSVPASHRRRAGHLVAGAAGGFAGALFVASLGFSGGALAAAVVAVAAMVAGGVVISAVDVDTFYIDFGSFIPTALVSWSATVAAVVAAGEPARLIAGAGTGLAIGLGFEVVARVWGALRGKTQGGGDTLLVVVTAGVPAALAGSYQLGLGSMLAGSIALIVVWSVGRVRGRVTRDTPFAYGPYLFAGAGLATFAHTSGLWGAFTAAAGLSGL